MIQDQEKTISSSMSSTSPRFATFIKTIKGQLIQLTEEQVPFLGFGRQIIMGKSLGGMKIAYGSAGWRSRIASLGIETGLRYPVVGSGYSYCLLHDLPRIDLNSPLKTISSYGSCIYDIMSSMDATQTGVFGFCLIANKILYYAVIKPLDAYELMKNASTINEH